MKHYEAPEMEVIELQLVPITIASGGTGDEPGKNEGNIPSIGGGDDEW